MMLPTLLAAGLALQAAAPQQAEPVKPEAPVQAPAATPKPAAIGVMAVTEAMEKGFRACASQVADRRHLSAINGAELEKAGLKLGDTPDEEVATVASSIFGENPIYARVENEDGDVWVIGSATIPACKVTVANTKDAYVARQELDRRFTASDTWSADGGQSFEKGGVDRRAYVLNKTESGPHMVTFVDGPTELVNDGRGIQSIITVGIMKPGAE